MFILAVEIKSKEAKLYLMFVTAFSAIAGMAIAVNMDPDAESSEVTELKAENAALKKQIKDEEAAKGGGSGEGAKSATGNEAGKAGKEDEILVVSTGDKI